MLSSISHGNMRCSVIVAHSRPSAFSAVWTLRSFVGGAMSKTFVYHNEMDRQLSMITTWYSPNLFKY